MELLTSKISRYLFAVPFVVFGLFHLMGADNMAGMVPIPGGAFWVYLTGLAMIAAGVSFIIKKMDYWAGIGLGALLLIYVLSIHVPAMMNAADEMAGQMAMGSILKDLALAGAAFMMADGGSKTMS